MTQLQQEETVDVLICGSGSAGLACALWLAVYNHRYCNPNVSNSHKPITYKILETRDGPLEVGQADGVQCRTVEIYESFGLDHIIKHEGYWVNEISFWALDQTSGSQKHLRRTGRAADVQPGLSHQPHLILNQARINGLMIEKIKQFTGGSINVDYGWSLQHIESATPAIYPVQATAVQGNAIRLIRARYALGGDGAHSQVRRSLRIDMQGDRTDTIWGVMDVFPQTNFPDIRKKTTVRADLGTLVLIPREGDVMVRMYFELPPGTSPKTVKLEDLHERAKSMFQPFEMEFEKTFWWSAYAIGQRVADAVVDKTGHIFLGGDACHSHSPKAGQGMNASLQDGYNLGWKLGSLLTGQADEKILETYVQERHQYARQLIEFDRNWAKLFSAGANASPEEFNKAFVQAGVFTAGMAANYKDSDLTNSSISDQSLARKIVVGERMPSAQVVRMSDSKAAPLLETLQSDGRWRLLCFPGNIDVDKKSVLDKINNNGDYLGRKDGLLRTFVADSQLLDSRIEVILVLKGDRKKVEFGEIHDSFKPRRHDFDIQNLHNVYFDDKSWNWGHGQAYETLQIAEQGCIVVVRPDQYVAAVVSVDDLSKVKDWLSKILTPT